MPHENEPKVHPEYWQKQAKENDLNPEFAEAYAVAFNKYIEDAILRLPNAGLRKNADKEMETIHQSRGHLSTSERIEAYEAVANKLGINNQSEIERLAKEVYLDWNRH